MPAAHDSIGTSKLSTIVTPGRRLDRYAERRPSSGPGHAVSARLRRTGSQRMAWRTGAVLRRVSIRLRRMCDLVLGMALPQDHREGMSGRVAGHRNLEGRADAARP